jgi:predicted Zn-dependent protease
MSPQAFAERAPETEQAREKLANGTSLLRGEPTVKKSRSPCWVSGSASWCERAPIYRKEITMKFLKTLVVVALAAGCAVQSAGQADRRQPQPQPQPTAGKPTPSTKTVDPAVAERLQRVMVPLLAKMNKPRSPNEVKIGIMDDPHINAASAGNGEFYVTTGLLEKANDDQMRGVLAHELAHDDLGHVAKAQRLGAGLQIGMVLLDQIIPGSGNLTPIAGALISRSYSRKEEYEADRHGSEILQRAGYSRDVMINTLTWLTETEDTSGGGFFATHPATADRIEALKKS